MEMKKATTVATFGAALATLGVAQELQADIISLSFNPTSMPWMSGNSVELVELAVSFWQWNDSIGKTMTAMSLSAMDLATASQMIDPGTFAGTSYVYDSASATGVHYMAFSYGGNVGWFSFDLGGFGGAVTYLQGQYGTMGEAVHIPAPAGLALLALGAVGIRRKRSA